MDSKPHRSHEERLPWTPTGPTGDREPIAIIGIGCRFPGEANSPEAYWKILRDGLDVLTEIPPDRWDLRTFYDPDPGKPGKTNIRFGGFTKNIDQFDAHFFGISPREAAFMDPQQRLLLEVAWEALEDGGQVLERLGGTNTGVFIGISSYDYALVQTSYPDRNSIDVYTNTGGAMSIAANRISYSFNFKGPSAAIDTACSSSLYAVHLACDSLWKRTCPVALAGGVNILITPGPYIGFSRLAMLSSDGRCKAFDAKANGFVRSEGAGIVVLKPLSAAQADGDRIYALIRGTAINQDGRTTGLTVPSQSSQEALVREACKDAGVMPSQIQYVEAHGTGTLVGDPIEARALGTVLATGRAKDDYCAIGSVKTNIGHLEAGAGIAGLIKTALALKNKVIPPSLHFQEPNPEIPFDDLRLRVPTTLEPWTEESGTRLAGVNSFGFGGTNAHVVMQGVEDDSSSEISIESNGQVERNGHPAADHPAVLIPLSARGPDALKAVAATYEAFLKPGGDGASLTLQELSQALAVRRSHHDHRLALAAHTKSELLEQLAAFAAGQAPGSASVDRVVSNKIPKLAFVFSGQGPQWWAMGRQLLAQEPVFADMIRRCDNLIRTLGTWSLLEELTAEETQSRIQETAIAQPAIFAIQVALAALWQSWGIRPDAVVGHSVGEVAAAYTAGVLSLEDAVSVIFHRGRCMDLATTRGRMLAVGLPLEEAQRIADSSGDRIAIAAINSPSSITLSGDGAALEEVAQSLQTKEVFCRFLQVNYAFHSAQMDPVESELLEALQGIAPQPATLPMFSTVTGQRVEGPELGPEYWWHNVRQTVRFTDAMDRLVETEHPVVLELSPHPVLGGAVAECYHHRGQKVKALASLRRNEDERVIMLRSLGGLYTAGLPIRWNVVEPGKGRWSRLPSYPWQRESFWHESDESKESRLGKKGHPLLGTPCRTGFPSWEGYVDRRLHPYLDDHRVQGHALVPATGFLEIALAVGKHTFGTGPYVLEDIRLLKACFLSDDRMRVMQTIFHPEDGSFDIFSRAEDTPKAWTHHVSGVLRSRQEEPTTEPFCAESIQARCPEELSANECYAALKKLGLQYGPTFQGIERLWRGEGEALGRINVPESLKDQPDSYHCHPAILDACLQVCMGAMPVTLDAGDAHRGIFLPVEIEQVRVYGRPGQHLWSHARLVERTRLGVVAEVRVYDESGKLIWEARGLRCQSVGVGGSGAESLDDLLYEYDWQLQPRPDQVKAQRELGFLDGLGEICGSVQAEAAQLSVQHGLKERYSGLEQLLNRLCTVYVLDAFRKLGADLQPGQRFSADAFAARLGIITAHRRLLDRYLAMLADDGILRQVDGEWEVRQAPPLEDPQVIWQTLLAQTPAFFAEFTLIRRCGRQLADVLRGAVNPLQLIFPDGSLATAEHLYQDSPSVRFYNTLARQAIRKVLDRLPEDRTIRILEIGAGTGGLTSYVLPMLPAERTEYVFTDLSNHFFIKAEQKFSDCGFVKYQKLDVEKPPSEQGFAEHTFDLVLASQVLHATADLRQTLDSAKKLLASEGLLVLLEVVKPARWIDLVFGLTEGWWRFADTDIRPSYPLLSFPAWESLLKSVGFTEAVDVSGSEAEGGLGSAVILGRGPRVPQKEQRIDTATGPVEEPGSWLIFADRGGTGEQLAGRLRANGQRCILAFAGETDDHPTEDHFVISPGSLEDMQHLVREMFGADRLACRGVIHLWNLDAPDCDGLTTKRLEAAQTEGCLSVINLVQAWNEVAGDRTSRLWLVTRGSQSVGQKSKLLSLAQTPVWGLGRVIINEYPRLRCKMIDLGNAGSAVEAESLFEEFRVQDEEDEVALRGEARYVHRYQRTSLDKQARDALQGGQEDNRPYRLTVSRSGTIDGLSLTAAERQQPGPGQVEIQVFAAGLNFSDVMKALGLYPGLPEGPIPLGIECSGKVTAIGEGVDFQVGDEVVAIAPFSFGAYVLTYAPLVAHKPERISFEEAATIPIAFLTAAYALEYLGRISEGERVLIHAATGGVGLAAIQLARRAGAEVFATAGNPEKRQFLQSLGVEHVMDSRSVAFADEVMRDTGGRGVDLVLNSLAGEAISKGLSVLADYGRFLEIGKRDIYQNTPIGLRPFRKNLSFIAIDLDRAMRERPAVLSGLFQQVVKDVQEGKLSPLPHRVFSIANVVSAFRFMAQAKQIGKVVLSFQEQPTSITGGSVGRMKFRADATYLLTGGLGGFALTVAQWMVEQGARNLVLMGRRGIHSPESEQAVEALRRAGARIEVAKADVSQPEQVAEVLSLIDKDMPPLRGVLHAAMYLEDCLLLKLDHERLMKVVAPKMGGAWNLHLQTLNQPLDFFVLFGSMSSQFGLPGQGNYAASNLFLDSLCYHRRALGLPALTISWGYLAEVGYVARNEKIAERLEGQGVRSFTPRQALALLESMLRNGAIQAGVSNIDWTRWRGLGAASGISPRFQSLCKEAEGGEDGSKQDGVAVRRMLLAAPPDRRRELLLGVVRDKVARVLGTSAAKVDVEKPLTELGLDSLMAVELRNWVEGELRLTLPVVELMRGPSVARLSELLLEQLNKGDAKPVAVPAVPDAPAASNNGKPKEGDNGSITAEQAEELLAKVDDLPNEQVDSLLDAMLAGKEQGP